MAIAVEPLKKLRDGEGVELSELENSIRSGFAAA
jgi:hypothetical protein